MAQIHPSSIVDSKAELASDVIVGPFCIVGPNVRIGSGTHLRSHVVVEGHTTIGERNVIYQGAAIGCAPQDKKYRGEPTQLIIGDDNVIRENTTFSIGTTQDKGITQVGSRGLFMVGSHIAHDCVVGNDVILANNVALGGHVHLEDFVIIGGQAACHQFVKVGANAMIGGCSAVVQDVPPYVICHLNPCVPAGLNLVGLRRHGFTDKTLRALRQAYGAIYRENLTITEAAQKITEIASAVPEAQKELLHMRDFIVASERGIIRPKAQ